jgi:hypothetical protein
MYVIQDQFSPIVTIRCYYVHVLGSKVFRLFYTPKTVWNYVEYNSFISLGGVLFARIF